MAAGRHGLDDARAHDEVPELLALLALLGVTAEDGREQRDDLVLRHRLCKKGIEALAHKVTPKIHVVGAWSLADKADLGHGRPAAGVGAARHADDDVILAKAATLRHDLEAAHERRQVTLCLCKGQGARGQGHAGYHVPPEAADRGLAVVRHMILLEQLLHRGLFRLRHLRDDDRLVACHSEGAAAFQDLGDFPQRRAALVLHAADGHEDAAVPKAVVGLHPAVKVATRLELVRLGGLQLFAEALLDLFAVEVRAVVLHGVLYARVLPVRAVAVITGHRQDGLADVFGVPRQAEADDVGQPRVRLLVVVREAEAAAHSDVEALEDAALNDGDETNAVRKDVHVIGGRDGHGHLELPRQVGLAVEGFLLHRRATEDLALLRHLLAVHQEDLVVSASARQAVVVDCIGVAHDLVHERAAADGGVGGAEDVAADIAARGDGVHARAVDRAHRALDVALQHAMQLPRLARGDFQRAVGELPRHVVHRYPLLGGAVAAREPHADHEAESALKAELLTLVPQVAVVLLVAAVEFDELCVLEGHLTRRDVVKRLLERAAELVCLSLDDLVRLHRPVLLGRATSGLVDAQAREELRLPLPKARVVLVHVLVVAKTQGQEALGAEACEELVELPRGLRKVDLGLLRPFAPIVRIPKAEDSELHAAEGTLELLGAVVDRLPEAAPVARELALAGGGDDEDNAGLACEGTDVEGVQGAAAHGAGGVAAAAALPRHGFPTLLRVAGVRGVEDRDRLRGVAQALAQLTALALGALRLAYRLLRDHREEVLPREESFDLLPHAPAIGQEGAAPRLLAARVVGEGRPLLVALDGRGLREEHERRPAREFRGRAQRRGRPARAKLRRGHKDAAILHGAQHLHLRHWTLRGMERDAEPLVALLQGAMHFPQRTLAAGKHGPAL
mmetsp:Transcript_116638/g.362407  ORF Transcript_116638/g.362407 Transcript_116638/m.362407 type:complete len:906 (+) Transcript_116638:140-2857(+)